MSAAHHVDSALHPTPGRSPLVLNLQCINDFRLFQNQRKLISLQTWATAAIHKNLPTWAEKLKILKILLPPLSEFLSVSCFSSFLASSRATASSFTIEELMFRLGCQCQCLEIIRF